MPKYTRKKCAKCDNEANYNQPDYLCDYHWADWWAYSDPETREESLNMIEEEYGIVQRQPLNIEE